MRVEAAGLKRCAIVVVLLLVFLVLVSPSPALSFWTVFHGAIPLAVCAFCIGFYFYKVKIDLFGACVLGYFAILAIDACLTGASLFTCARYNLSFTSTALFARAVFPTHKVELLWSLVILFGSYTVFNALDLAGLPFGRSLFREGNAGGFLSHRNSFSRFYLVAITASALLDYYRGKRFSIVTAICFLAAFAQAIMLPSATSSVALAVFVLGFVLTQFKKTRVVLNAAVFGVGTLMAFFGIVLLRLQDVFAPFVENVLHKDLTFTGRTYIWDTILNRLGSDPLHLLIGFYGDFTQLSPTDPVISTAHNAILEVVHCGGLIGLACVGTVFFLALRNLFRQRHAYPAALLAICLGAFLIIGFAEHITCPQVWLLLGTAYALRGEGPAGEEGLQKLAVEHPQFAPCL